MLANLLKSSASKFSFNKLTKNLSAINSFVTIAGNSNGFNSTNILTLEMVKNKYINLSNHQNVQFYNNCIRNYSKSYKPDRKMKDDHDSDSDSDNEGNTKTRGNSEFWRRKMRTLHGLLDLNKDGVISYDDYCLLTKKFADVGHLSNDEILEFQQIIKKSWEEQFGEISPYNLVTVEQYLNEIHHMINDKELRGKVHYFLPYLFKAVDKDHSGFISLTEFKIFFKCLGLTDENAAVSFAIIDKNSDGKLSIKEFVKLGRDFFLTEDERKISRMFWGPLVN